MSAPIDQEARERFTREGQVNFAVSANAGSGKTTAISRRLAHLALDPHGASGLAHTAVVTYTKKAARQIGQKARAVLLSELEARGATDLRALDGLERVFFGTIHSFCLQLAQRYGHRLGVHLNPTVMDEQDETAFGEFLAADPLVFRSLPEEHWRAFLRLGKVDDLFPLVRSLDRRRAEALRRRLPAHLPTSLPAGPLERLRTDVPKLARSREAWRKNQETVERWLDEMRTQTDYVGLPKPVGTANGVEALFVDLFAPVKQWIADVSGVLAAELADRYRVFRLERGWQTYADQVELAMTALGDPEILDRIRADGWRVILDEAQDTDPQQFAVLVEIARPVGAPVGTWPTQGGVPPRPGHFCLVGDGQQSIYGSRADIRNFRRHVDAFARGDGGEVLEFTVSFRAPAALIRFLNEGLPPAFSAAREHNCGLPPDEGAPAPLLQVPYQPLAPSPVVKEGRVSRWPLRLPATAPKQVEAWLQEEAEQIADLLLARGPAGVGAQAWGDVALLAPRNGWLAHFGEVLTARGLKVSLQQRRNRSAENPVYAWLTGLAAVVTDPGHTFEWFGVLREVFAVSDELLAVERRRLETYRWDEPTEHPEPLASALEVLRPLILAVDDPGSTLADFVERLVVVTALREKARTLDSSGALEAELDRLVAEAQALGLEGAGPREWAQGLIEAGDKARPAGQPERDAINLLTVHSAKGLEWPVVILGGLWHGIGKMNAIGLRFAEASDGLRVYFGLKELPADLRLSQHREMLRENLRLFYVALTRPQSHLILPWAEGFGKAGRGDELSFAELWGDTSAWMALPEIQPEGVPDLTAGEERVMAPDAASLELEVGATGQPRPPLPERVLPHQLAEAPDMIRATVATAWEGFAPTGSADDAVNYGLWWHETVEHWPWGATPAIEDAYVAEALADARLRGWGDRGETELPLWRSSAARRDAEDPAWWRQAEVSLLAPLADGRWIDGVVDLLLHDPARDVVWLVDWKTNRRRRDESDEALAERLAREYAPQLGAYREGLRSLFPNARFRLSLYPTALGRWVDLPVL